jgi:hypothetical protein
MLANLLQTRKKPDLQLFSRKAPNWTLEITDKCRSFQYFSKVLERIVHQQLYSYLTENNILIDAQSGFRKKLWPVN